MHHDTAKQGCAQAATVSTRATERALGVTVAGQVLRAVVREGTDPGVPLLLCNGIGAAHAALVPFVDALDPAITTIRFDVPGCGDSPPWPFPVPYHVIAWAASRLVRTLGYDRFDVLGISWGGALAQQIAFQHPRRCRRVVLVATATGSVMVPARPSVLRHLLSPARYLAPQHRERVAGHLYGGAVRHDPALATLLLGGSSPSRTGYAHQLLAGAGWTSLPWLPFIGQRTLILAGTDDPIIPIVNARIMVGLLPNAQLREYDDGHLALITAADEHAPVVARFLRSP